MWGKLIHGTASFLWLLISPRYLCWVCSQLTFIQLIKLSGACKKNPTLLEWEKYILSNTMTEKTAQTKCCCAKMCRCHDTLPHGFFTQDDVLSEHCRVWVMLEKDFALNSKFWVKILLILYPNLFFSWHISRINKLHLVWYSCSCRAKWTLLFKYRGARTALCWIYLKPTRVVEREADNKVLGSGCILTLH